jgi:hypothetical protein
MINVDDIFNRLIDSDIKLEDPIIYSTICLIKQTPEKATEYLLSWLIASSKSYRKLFNEHLKAMQNGVITVIGGGKND